MLKRTKYTGRTSKRYTKKPGSFLMYQIGLKAVVVYGGAAIYKPDRMLDMGFEPQMRQIVEGGDMPAVAGAGEVRKMRKSVHAGQVLLRPRVMQSCKLLPEEQKRTVGKKRMQLTGLDPIGAIRAVDAFRETLLVPAGHRGL
eukprot:jgi/Mesen1/7686/ME000405S06975